MRRTLLVLVAFAAIVLAPLPVPADDGGTRFVGPTHPTEPGSGKGSGTSPVVKA